jgi:hypothetical protein
MESTPPLLTPLTILLTALYFLVPIVIIFLLARVIRASVTPQQREMQRKLNEIVELQKETNRLLARLIEDRLSDSKQE